MPPRHTYWTIILEGKPTAFRAHTQDELLPTLKQLQSRHPDAVLMWFARGRLWKSEEESREAMVRNRRPPQERRGPAWRPGGSHEDPRARFKIPRDEKRRRFRERLFRDNTPDDREVPVGEKTERPPRQDGPRPKPAGPWSKDRRPPRPGDRPWRPPQDRTGRPEGPSGRKPEWKPNRPAGGDRGERDRSWKPSRPEGQEGRPRENRGWKPDRPSGKPGENRGWKPGRPPGKPGENRGWKPNRPSGGGSRPGGRGGHRPPGGGRKGGGGGGSSR
jgi:hypothetical protein